MAATRKSGIKFAPNVTSGTAPERSAAEKPLLPGGRSSVAQAVRAGSKRASMMAESLLTQLQVGFHDLRQQPSYMLMGQYAACSCIVSHAKDAQQRGAGCASGLEASQHGG